MANDIDLWQDIKTIERIIRLAKKRNDTGMLKYFEKEHEKVLKEFTEKYI